VWGAKKKLSKAWQLIFQQIITKRLKAISTHILTSTHKERESKLINKREREIYIERERVSERVSGSYEYIIVACVRRLIAIVVVCVVVVAVALALIVVVAIVVVVMCVTGAHFGILLLKCIFNHKLNNGAIKKFTTLTTLSPKSV